MHNKILIVNGNQKECEQLELILQPIIDEGGELLFAYKTENGLKMLQEESPKLVFLDASAVGEKEDFWVAEGVHIILMRQRSEKCQQSEDFILKPLKAHQVLEKCRLVLDQETAFPLPPM